MENNKNKCDHKFVSFLGIQKSRDKNKTFYLFNCDFCHSTISILDSRLEHYLSLLDKENKWKIKLKIVTMMKLNW